MHHNPKESNYKHTGNLTKNAKLPYPKGSIHIKNTAPHENESDFGVGSGDPDNIRRQRQDYSDKWEMAHHKSN